MTGVRGQPVDASLRGRVVVAGAGFIGRALARRLLGDGRPTTIVSRRLPAEDDEYRDARRITGDLAEPTTVEDALEDAEHLIFAAGGLLPGAAARDPRADAQLALNPLLTCLAALERRPGVRLTFLGSGGTVYGLPRALPISEDEPTDPITAYGVSKLASEKYIGMQVRVAGLGATILRLANVYGPGQTRGRSQGIVGVMLDRALSGEPVELWGDGSVRRDYVHIDDAVDVIVRLLDAPPVAPLNVGTGVATSVLEVLEIVESVVGDSLAIARMPARPFDVPAIALDVSRLRATVPWDPLSLRRGVEATWCAMSAGTSACTDVS